MRLCELRQKEVINEADCKRLGYICDVDIDMCKGKVISIIIPGPCKVWGVIGRDHEYIIPFCCIKQVGPDIIIVNIDEEKCFVKCKG